MDLRILPIFALLTIVAGHDIIVGQDTSGRKIYDEKKEASPAIWRQSDNVTVIANNEEVISRVVITDLRPEKDGDAKIVEGGEGQKNVTIELKSPTLLRGYNFHIEVFASPDKSTGVKSPSEVGRDSSSGLNSPNPNGNTPRSATVPANVQIDDHTRQTRASEEVKTNEEKSTLTPIPKAIAEKDNITPTPEKTRNSRDTEQEKGATDLPKISNSNDKDTAFPNLSKKNSESATILPAVIGSDLKVKNEQSRQVRDTQAQESTEKTEPKAQNTGFIPFNAGKDLTTNAPKTVSDTKNVPAQETNRAFPSVREVTRNARDTEDEEEKEDSEKSKINPAIISKSLDHKHDLPTEKPRTARDTQTEEKKDNDERGKLTPVPAILNKDFGRKFNQPTEKPRDARDTQNVDNKDDKTTKDAAVPSIVSQSNGLKHTLPTEKPRIARDTQNEYTSTKVTVGPAIIGKAIDGKFGLPTEKPADTHDGQNEQQTKSTPTDSLKIAQNTQNEEKDIQRHTDKPRNARDTENQKSGETTKAEVVPAIAGKPFEGKFDNPIVNSKFGQNPRDELTTKSSVIDSKLNQKNIKVRSSDDAEKRNVRETENVDAPKPGDQHPMFPIKGLQNTPQVPFTLPKFGVTPEKTDQDKNLQGQKLGTPHTDKPPVISIQ